MRLNDLVSTSWKFFVIRSDSDSGFFFFCFCAFIFFFHICLVLPFLHYQLSDFRFMKGSISKGLAKGEGEVVFA